MYLVGFLFWGTPLANLAFRTVGDGQSAAVQAALAQNLTAAGTGTYSIPSTATGQGTVLFGKGPIATVHFNTSGFPAVDTSALLGGLVLALVAGVIFAAALGIVAKWVPTFADRARAGILFALAVTLYLDLGQPIFNHYGPGYFIYTFLADLLGFVAAALVIARWFLPAPRGADTV
jgi:hypothetical protein